MSVRRCHVVLILLPTAQTSWGLMDATHVQQRDTDWTKEQRNVLVCIGID